MANLYFGNDADLILDGMRLASDNSPINDAVLVAHFFLTAGKRTVTDAENATPIVVTTETAHGLSNGDEVVLAHVLGNTAANGHWTVANVTADTFELSGSAGNGSYVRGGDVYDAVTGGTDISMDYVASSNGRYVGVITSDINLLPNESCRCIVLCSNYDFQMERDHTCQIRT